MVQLRTIENLQCPASIKKKKLTDMKMSRKISFLTRRKSKKKKKNSPRNDRDKGITRKAH